MKELYRVCKDGAIIHVIVPNPFHSDFLDDPTHCWPVTANTFRLFDKEFNKMCVEKGMSNSTLGLDYDIDFKIVTEYNLTDNLLYPFPTIFSKTFIERYLINSINAIEMFIEVRKGE
jgi:hypothetical protein